MKIEQIDIDKLIPYINNPRINDNAVDKVAASIKEFGFKNPILIDKDNVIIAGHTRLLASKKLGLSEVPIIKIEDLTENQIKAFRIADNKTSEFAEWDMKLLAIELEEAKELFTGFDSVEMEDLFEEDKEIIEDDYEVEVPEEPKAKLGDVYQLGRHRLICGDSTKKEDVDRLMCGYKADMFLTDPPYNVDYIAKTKKALTIKNDKMDDGDFRIFLKDAFTQADKALKAGGVFYIWHSEQEVVNFRGACYDVGWQVRQCLIWNKSHWSLGRQDYHWKHEPCLYGWKEGAGHLWASDRKQTTVLNFDKPFRNKEHPTMKPIAIFDYQIKNNTKAEDIVLDLFGGSGTAIIACEQNGRVCYMMELDPKYIDVIIDRWESFTGEKAVLLNE